MSNAAPQRMSQEERRETTRANLIRATVDCIREHGYAATRTTEIATRAGVTRGALQYHFPTKPDLVIGVVADISQQILEHLEIAGRVQGSVRERVSAALERIWQVYRSTEYLAVVEILSATRSDSELAAKLQEHTAQTESRLQDWWAAFFADVGVPSERGDSLRHLARQALRGMAIETDFEELPASFYEQQVGFLAEMLADAIEAATSDQPAASST